MNILAIAAHPDDEVLGAGGTLARFAAQEHSVRIGILGKGITSRYTKRSQAPTKELDQIERAARKAARILGARSIEVSTLPDNQFDTVPLLDIVKQVEAWVRKWRPSVVYTHHLGDLNIDHALTARAVLTATRPGTAPAVAEVYSFEVPSSTEWGFGQIEPVFRPTTFVDISKTLKTKLRAMEAYAGEIREFPHPRSVKALEAGARRWGSVSGLHAAEAFQLVRAIR